MVYFLFWWQPQIKFQVSAPSEEHFQSGCNLIKLVANTKRKKTQGKNKRKMKMKMKAKENAKKTSEILWIIIQMQDLHRLSFYGNCSLKSKWEFSLNRRLIERAAGKFPLNTKKKKEKTLDFWQILALIKQNFLFWRI